MTSLPSATRKKPQERLGHADALKAKLRQRTLGGTMRIESFVAPGRYGISVAWHKTPQAGYRCVLFARTVAHRSARTRLRVQKSKFR
jgi:hypothetical protein